MAIKQFNLADSMAAPMNMLARQAQMEYARNMLAGGGGLPTETYNAMAATGGPTREAAATIDSSDWTSGRTDGVSPELIGLLEELRTETGIPFVITEGLRDEARQREMVAQGKSQTMNSRHLHGNAIDIAITNPDGSINWDFDAYVPLGEAYKRLAQERGYNNAVWGGDWKSLRDGVHFQLG